MKNLLKSDLKVVHIFISPFKAESRVIKQMYSLKDACEESIVSFIGIKDEDVAPYEIYAGKFQIFREEIKSRPLPRLLFFQTLKYIEWVWRAYYRLKRLKPDIIHCHSLGALPVAVLSKFKLKCGLIYDAHEFETKRNGVNRFRSRIYSMVEKFLIKYADKVIAVSDSIANEYSQLYNIPKPSLVLNCPLYTEVIKKDLFRKEFGIRSDQTIFLYQGGISKGRGIEILLEAFSNSCDDKNVIMFMGYGPLEELIKKKMETQKTIFFKQAVSPLVLLDYTASADFGISFIEDSCLSYRYCLPNKMFEYLMARLPIIVSNLFEMKKVVDKCNIGVVAETNTVYGLIHAIKKIKEMDYNTLLTNVDQAREKYSWEVSGQVLLGVYREVQ